MGIIYKRTKILATVGPKTNSYEMIEALASAGVNGFRLNFSHGNYDERDQQIEWIRRASKKVGKPVAILQDLQGPKIRLGMLKHDVHVNEGDILTLDFEASHDDLVIPIQYNLAEKVRIGERIYIFDGKIRTTVTGIVSGTAITVKVENSGILMSRKGINLPDTDFGGDILTPKDIDDIEFGVTRDFDYVGLSFVQRAEDIEHLRQLLVAGGSDAQIVAKIETRASIVDDVLEDIVKASDAVMVARGDLAVEAGAEIVPIVQRRIITLCRKYGKLCIVATQMMASMVDSPEPTRAEVSDVSNAVIQGADTVMLSDETANGHYPIEAVQAMKKVILYTQDHEPVEILKDKLLENEKQRDAISVAAISLAKQLKASAIVVETLSGATAVNMSAHRPNFPIVSVTSQQRTAQQLALNYATRSYVRPDGPESGHDLAKELKAEGYFDEDKLTLVVVSGKHPGTAGTTDTIKVRTIQ
ncbi:pyruvate kinase [Candidatus Saccharibacteria bacterium]|nr:pyruvate kinase [Candidatus Saccharibacteria bacterium]